MLKFTCLSKQLEKSPQRHSGRELFLVNLFCAVCLSENAVEGKHMTRDTSESTSAKPELLRRLSELWSVAGLDAIAADNVSARWVWRLRRTWPTRQPFA